jgi:3-oxoacyl-[acyl-carrier protein] reductase
MSSQSSQKTSPRVFVTGGGGAVGSEIVSLLKKRSYKVEAPSSHELDLSRIETIQNYLSDHRPQADILIYVAGINFPQTLTHLDLKNLNRTWAVNAMGFAVLAQYFARSMRSKRSSIVAVSSVYGRTAREGRLAYTASKAALNGMVQTLALELGPKGIRVNSVSPGFLDTPLTRRNNRPAQIKKLMESVPLRRLGTPKDVALAVEWLVGENSSFMHGADLVLDGGFLAGRPVL